MLGALCYAELGTLMPKAGGEYQYFRAAFGPLPAFVYVCMSFIMGGASLAAYGAAFGIFLSDLVALPPPWIARTLDVLGQEREWQLGVRQLISLGVIGVFTCVNLAGVRFGGRVQAFLTTIKVIALVGLIGGVYLLSPGHDTTASAAAVTPPATAVAPSASAFGFAMLSALWAYSGWQYLPMAAGEVRDPARNVPRAVIGGGLLVLTIYLLVNSAYFHAPLTSSSSPRTLSRALPRSCRSPARTARTSTAVR
jgi:APA family basic amino acid/polyamine antiporter